MARTSSKKPPQPSKGLLDRAQHDAKVEVAADMIQKVRQLVDEMRKRQFIVERLMAELAVEAGRVRKLGEETIPTMFDSLGVSELKLDDGTKIKIDTVYHPQVLKDDEPELFAWLKKNKYDSIIKNQIVVAFGMGDDKKAAALYKQLHKEYRAAVAQKKSIHPGTFKAFVREQMEKGANLPSVINPNPVRATIIK